MEMSKAHAFTVPEPTVTHAPPQTTTLVLENPYWDIVSSLPGARFSFDGRWCPDGMPGYRDLSNTLTWEEREAMPNRRELVRTYAWAIPSPDTIAFVLEVLDGRPVVDMGAGTGYWAWLLTQAGVDVNAYDKNPPNEPGNHWHSGEVRIYHKYTEEEKRSIREHYDQLKEIAASLVSDDAEEYPPFRESDGEWGSEPSEAGVVYHPVIRGDMHAVALRENHDRVLLLSWPPYGEAFGEEVIRAYRGDTIIYIGEPCGGCNGDDGMFELLNTEWTEVDSFPLIQWDGLHDQLIVYRRRTNV